jgi:hypothetical protein
LPSFSAIHSYCGNGWNSIAFDSAVEKLREALAGKLEELERIEVEKNIEVIEAYRKKYGHRKFVIRTNHRLWFWIGRLKITAQPDLWVEENGVQYLIKIGAAKKNLDYIDVLLAIIQKAARARKFNLAPDSFLYLDVATGLERRAESGYRRFNLTFAWAARRIIHLWRILDSENVASAQVANVRVTGHGPELNQ